MSADQLVGSQQGLQCLKTGPTGVSHCARCEWMLVWALTMGKVTHIHITLHTQIQCVLITLQHAITKVLEVHFQMFQHLVLLLVLIGPLGPLLIAVGQEFGG